MNSTFQSSSLQQQVDHLDILKILRELTLLLPSLSPKREFAAHVAEARARLGALFESMPARAFAGEL
jgi:hypothetical protein